MRAGIIVTSEDRGRLELIVGDRNTPQKHAVHARVILATAEGCGTLEIIRRSGLSKPLTKGRLKHGVFRSAINQYLAEHNENPKLFVWTDPSRVLAAIERGKQALEFSPLALTAIGQITIMRG
jgi:hypothetical protein